MNNMSKLIDTYRNSGIIASRPALRLMEEKQFSLDHARKLQAQTESESIGVNDVRAYDLPQIQSAKAADVKPAKYIAPSKAAAQAAFEEVAYHEAWSLTWDGKTGPKLKPFALKFPELCGCEGVKSNEIASVHLEKAGGFIVAIRNLAAEQQIADAKAMAENIRKGKTGYSYNRRFSGGGINGYKQTETRKAMSGEHTADHLRLADEKANAVGFVAFD